MASFRTVLGMPGAVTQAPVAAAQAPVAPALMPPTAPPAAANPPAANPPAANPPAAAKPSAAAKASAAAKPPVAANPPAAAKPPAAAPAASGIPKGAPAGAPPGPSIEDPASKLVLPAAPSLGIPSSEVTSSAIQFPNPTYNKNIPVVTANGGKLESYNDPTSPEALLSQIVKLQAQAAMDTKYDTTVSPYYEIQSSTIKTPIPIPQSNTLNNSFEGFVDSNEVSSLQIFLIITILAFIALIIFKKTYKSIKMSLIVIGLLSLITVVGLFKSQLLYSSR